MGFLQSRQLSESTILIVGLGLIGGSVGMKLKSSWPRARLVGYDVDNNALKKALDLKAIDEIANSLGDGTSKCEAVILATPVSTVVPLIRDMLASLGDRAVFEFGSSKARVAHELRPLLSKVNVIGVHPMAGSEQSGIAAGNPNLFSGCTCIITPYDLEDFERRAALIAAARELAVAIGCTPVVMSPDLHDMYMAYVSHAPYMIACALSLTLKDFVEAGYPDAVMLAAGGFKDTTRVAASAPSMAGDMCIYNSSNLSKALAHFARNLNWLISLLESDADRFSEALMEAKQLRDKLACRQVMSY